MAELTLTEAQHGGRFTVHVGDTIDLRLSENASTGYRWSIASLDRALLQVEAEDYDAGNGAVGSGGTVAWVLRANRAGSGRLELVKSRAWEGQKEADERFAVELRIVS